jgi:hypothetical protein
LPWLIDRTGVRIKQRERAAVHSISPKDFSTCSESSGGWDHTGNCCCPFLNSLSLHPAHSSSGSSSGQSKSLSLVPLVFGVSAVESPFVHLAVSSDLTVLLPTVFSDPLVPTVALPTVSWETSVMIVSLPAVLSESLSGDWTLPLEFSVLPDLSPLVLPPCEFSVPAHAMDCCLAFARLAGAPSQISSMFSIMHSSGAALPCVSQNSSISSLVQLPHSVVSLLLSS